MGLKGSLDGITKPDPISLKTLDVSNGGDFCQAKESSFDMVTSFSCLHWVPNQPDAVSLFNKVLKPGGKFLFVIAGTHNQQDNLLRREYEAMRNEAKWADALRPTKWMHFKTVHVNTSWMTTADETGGNDYNCTLHLTVILPYHDHHHSIRR